MIIQENFQGGGGGDTGSAYAPPASSTTKVVDTIISVSTDTLVQNNSTLLQNSIPKPNVNDVLPLNTAVLTQGFGSYLDGILPPDIATACGAFSASMRQVRNIENVPIEKFAQVAVNMETTKGLDLVNGTNVPTNLSLASGGAALVALGSGPDGTYTDSDFFGAMSGLPYPWKDITTNIQSLQTSTLDIVYQQLYLAVTWEQATFEVTTTERAIETSPGSGLYDWQYKITGTTMTDSGGGYTRNGAPDPGGTYTFSDGTLASSGGVLLTTNPDRDSNNTSTFGRMINFLVTGLGSASWVTYATNQGSATPTSPGLQYRLPAPPITYNSTYTGASNSSYGTSGWPGMNSVVQDLIDDANDEISSIAGNKIGAIKLNTLWNITGTQLTIEQRARLTVFPPVPVPKDVYLSQFPTTLMSFVDSIPQFAINTLPHMYSQTLEAISDWKTPGGQSIVGAMRQERNAARLNQVGIPLDNNMAGEVTPKTSKLLIANGTVSVAAPGAGIPIDNATFTIPSTLAQIDNLTNDIVSPVPVGFYDNSTDVIEVPDVFVDTDILGTLPGLANDNEIVEPGDDEAGFDPILDTSPALINPIAGTTKLPSGGTITLDTGKAGVPGSLAGSNYQNTLPVSLQLAFTSSALTPSTYNVQEAIDEVVKCNCDCWIN